MNFMSVNNSLESYVKMEYLKQLLEILFCRVSRIMRAVNNLDEEEDDVFGSFCRYYI